MRVIKIVDGPTSYPTGGFEIAVGEYEKISDCNVEMHPDTILGTTIIPGFKITLATTKAAATVQVFQMKGVEAWAEVAAGTNLSAAKFVLSGDAI